MNSLSINPEREFLIVKHDALNNPQINLDQIINEAENFSDCVNGKQIVPACEGDLYQIAETEELVFIHKHFGKLSQDKFLQARAAGKAAYFNDVLDQYEQIRLNYDKFMFIIELKLGTNKATINKALDSLFRREIDLVCFDSFFGEKLNQINSLMYERSLHCLGNIRGLSLVASVMPENYDYLTIPYPISFGSPGKPVIYGAVGSKDKIKALAESPLTLGVYARTDEKNTYQMLAHSIKR